MLDGIPASQDVNLVSMARRLQEKVPLIKAEDGLSCNLAAEDVVGTFVGRRVIWVLRRFRP